MKIKQTTKFSNGLTYHIIQHNRLIGNVQNLLNIISTVKTPGNYSYQSIQILYMYQYYKGTIKR